MEIDRKIEEAEKNLKELKEEKEQIERSIRYSRFDTFEVKVAELLHEKLCTLNHIDMCGWYYGNWSDEVLNYSREEYLKKAKEVINFLNVFGFSENNMLDFIENFITIIKN